MWTSVPQIEATLIRIWTSSGPGSGLGTCFTTVLFGAGFSFTAAFILSAMAGLPPREGGAGGGAGEARLQVRLGPPRPPRARDAGLVRLREAYPSEQRRE